MTETTPIRISLYETAFRQLVAGDVVRTAGTPTIEITLADIGFDRMISALNDAQIRLRQRLPIPAPDAGPASGS